MYEASIESDRVVAQFVNRIVASVRSKELGSVEMLPPLSDTERYRLHPSREVVMKTISIEYFV